jgi:hypothetical protein
LKRPSWWNGSTLRVAQPLAIVAVRVERGVDGHRPRHREQLDREAVLHQGLAAAEREAAAHRAQARNVDVRPSDIAAPFCSFTAARQPK